MDEHKCEEKEQDMVCNILWHWNSAFRRYESFSLQLAVKKWNEINNQASRIFLVNNHINKSWFKNDKWKTKILNFVSTEHLTIKPSHVIVVWYSDNKYLHKLFDSGQDALQYYNRIGVHDHQDNKLLSVNYEIVCSSFTNEECKTNITKKWLDLTIDENKMFYAAFSHRDSDQTNPLFDALHVHNGNIEFDVHCINSQLLIGHDLKRCKQDVSLQSLYLDPLKKLIQQHELKQPLNLFVDFKSDAKQSYLILHKLIKKEYGDVVTSWKYDRNTKKIIKQQRYINIVITGNRDIESILNTPNSNVLERYVCIDGRIADIHNNDIGYEYMPMISSKFTQVFPKCGSMNNYILNEDDKKRLMEFIRKCRLTKKRLRFWATIDSEKLWQQLIDLDVEKNVIVINADNQQTLIPFLIKNGY